MCAAGSECESDFRFKAKVLHDTMISILKTESLILTALIYLFIIFDSFSVPENVILC